MNMLGGTSLFFPARQLFVVILCSTALDAFAGDKVDELLSRLSRTKEESDRVHMISYDLWNVDDPRVEKEFMRRLSPEPTEEASNALRVFYPESPASFQSLDEMKSYYKKMVHQN